MGERWELGRVAEKKDGGDRGKREGRSKRGMEEGWEGAGWGQGGGVGEEGRKQRGGMICGGRVGGGGRVWEVSVEGGRTEGRRWMRIGGRREGK